MDINVIIDQITKALSGNNSLWAIGIMVVLYLIKSGAIKLPWNIPVLTPAPVDPVKSLRDRLRELAEGRFTELTDAGGDPDDVYKHLLDKLWEE